MKKHLYPRLAWNGIRKNGRLYTPYLLTCTGMVMMYYIISFLSVSQVLKGMDGGDVIQEMLRFGCGVMSVFAVIFLFYTNSFLIRRRKREFGLYNVLGMGKWNLARILVWESLIEAAVSLAAGLAAGIVFSKFAELGVVNILQAQTTFYMRIEWSALGNTACLFAVIFVLLLLNTLRQIHLARPVELLRSEAAGEKPPKANWVLAVAGALLLAGAYYLAVTIEEPLSAMLLFFVAVVMVIIATYLLFIAGSVVICRILQKKKNYYYKTSHFVSVSSMGYRMKRNGAGLASICILSTMVLVMLSATVCLYVGTEDSIRRRYPRNINLDFMMQETAGLSAEKTDPVRELVTQTIGNTGETMEQVLDYRALNPVGFLKDGTIILNHDRIYSYDLGSENYARQIFVVPLEDYNRLMGQQETLAEDEVLVCSTRSGYVPDTLRIDGGTDWKVKAKVDFVDNGVDAMQMIPSLYLFVSDLDAWTVMLQDCGAKLGNSMGLHLYYGFDLDCGDEKQRQLYGQLMEKVEKLTQTPDGSIASVTCESAAMERAGFYSLYGGLLFLGVLLGIVFVFAAVLIIYYKQVSEGYEDQSRFEIMQKVGMTRREIKRSINSQVLTVFFLPLITAGVHLMFAFPMVSRLLTLFNLTNRRLLLIVTIGCFGIFAVFYVLVYRITSRAYFSIVSGGRN